MYQNLPYLETVKEQKTSGWMEILVRAESWMGRNKPENERVKHHDHAFFPPEPLGPL